jgi:hypothetical protein
MTTQDVIDTIERYFSDKSRPASETREGLEEIQAEVESMLDALTEEG